MIFICRKYNFAYYPVGKVMNTSFKKWMVKLDNPDLNMEGLEPHRAAFDHLEWVATEDTEKREQVAKDTSLFKFVFVRNPYNRLSSCYTNKFVEMFNTKSLRELRKKWYTAHIDLLWSIVTDRRGKWRAKKGISFREFIDYICTGENRLADEHWIPQSVFLEPDKTPFNFIGKLEQSDEDIQRLYEALKIPEEDRFIEHVNRSGGAREKVDGSFVDTLSGELFKSGIHKKLSSKNFQDDGLLAKVKSAYADDYRAFGYE